MKTSYAIHTFFSSDQWSPCLNVLGVSWLSWQVVLVLTVLSFVTAPFLSACVALCLTDIFSSDVIPPLPSLTVASYLDDNRLANHAFNPIFQVKELQYYALQFSLHAWLLVNMNVLHLLYLSYYLYSYFHTASALIIF